MPNTMHSHEGSHLETADGMPKKNAGKPMHYLRSVHTKDIPHKSAVIQS